MALWQILYVAFAALGMTGISLMFPRKPWIIAAGLFGAVFWYAVIELVLYALRVS